MRGENIRLGRMSLDRTGSGDPFRHAFDYAPVALALTTLDGRIERANAALGALCGALAEALAGASLTELMAPADADEIPTALAWVAAGPGDEFVVELRLPRSDGILAEVRVHATAFGGTGTDPQWALWQFEDITERNAVEAQLRFHADHDPLTGLLSRRRFEEELTRQVAHVARYESGGALMLLDIDGFKEVNDTCGHQAGDQLLIAIADGLRSRLRDTDVVARLGGDEFAVLLPQADAAQAASVAQVVVRAIGSLIPPQGHARVSASVGVATFDSAEACDCTEMLNRVDQAMYAVKQAGGNGYGFFGFQPVRRWTHVTPGGRRMILDSGWPSRSRHAGPARPGIARQR